MSESTWADFIASLVREYGSQSELARRVGVSPQRVQRWLAGGQKPTVPLLRKIASRTNYSLPLLISVANSIPLAEMATGAGADLLPEDERLTPRWRQHIANQYDGLRLLSDALRADAVSDPSGDTASETHADGVAVAGS